MNTPQKIYLGDVKIWELATTNKTPSLLPLANFSVGNRVELTRPSNIREEPAISSSNLIGINLRGWRGTVVEGPVEGPGTASWFKVEFDRGAWNGWVVDDNFESAPSKVIRTPNYFTVDDRVQLFRKANVRDGSKLSAKLLKVAPKDSDGVIVDGPTIDSAFNVWYKIEFDDDDVDTGWVASDNYVLSNLVSYGDNSSPLPTNLLTSPATTYHHMLVRGKSAYDRGLPGGHPEQWMHAADRSISNPNVIVCGQDVSSFWRSVDNSKSWSHAPCRGLTSRWSAAVKIHPTNAGVWIAAMTAPGGGKSGSNVYITTNYGDDWKKVLTPQKAIPGAARPNSVGTGKKLHRHIRYLICFDYRNPSNVYFANPYDGLYKSSNGGNSWSKISSSSFSAMGRIFHIEVHTQNSNILYFACENGFYRSTNGGSTITKVGGGLPGATGINGDWKTSMDMNPADGDDVYVVCYGSGLYRSRNGGVSFTKVYSSNAAVIAVHRTNRNIMYLMRLGANLLYSSNGGASWTTCTSTLNDLGTSVSAWKQSISAPTANNANAERNMQVMVLPHPTDTKQAFATAGAAFFKTVNNKNWTNGGYGFCSLAWGHGNSGNIAFDLNDHRRFMIFCFDVGAYLTENGANWFESRGSGKQGTAWQGQYSGSFCPGNTQRIVSTVGMYSNNASITVSHDGGRSWFAPLSGNSTRKITWSSWHTQNQNIVYCDTHRSLNAGRNWSTYGGGFPNGGRACGVSRSNGDVVYAVAGDGRTIYRSTNAGASWSQYHKASSSLLSLQRITPFEIHPFDPNTIYVGSGGGVQVYNGRSASMLGLTGKNISSVKVDARHPDVIYAKNEVNGNDMIWRSTNSGGSWTNISYNLPRSGSNRNMEVHPLTGDVFVGGTIGTRILPPPYSSPNSIHGKFKLI